MIVEGSPEFYTEDFKPLVFATDCRAVEDRISGGGNRLGRPGAGDREGDVPAR